MEERPSPSNFGIEGIDNIQTSTINHGGLHIRKGDDDPTSVSQIGWPHTIPVHELFGEWENPELGIGVVWDDEEDKDPEQREDAELHGLIAEVGHIPPSL